MKISLAKGIAAAVITEIAADSAIIGGVLAAKKKAPVALPVVAGCLVVVGAVALVKAMPSLEAGLAKLAADQGLLDKFKA